jgi:hypothetical protein
LFSFALPVWFDGARRGTVALSSTGPPSRPPTNLIDLVADLPIAYVLVMSYRNFACGTDGSIHHARREFRYARQVGAACGAVVSRVIVAGERVQASRPACKRTSRCLRGQ